MWIFPLIPTQIFCFGPDWTTNGPHTSGHVSYFIYFVWLFVLYCLLRTQSCNTISPSFSYMHSNISSSLRMLTFCSHSQTHIHPQCRCQCWPSSSSSNWYTLLVVAAGCWSADTIFRGQQFICFVFRELSTPICGLLRGKQVLTYSVCVCTLQDIDCFPCLLTTFSLFASISQELSFLRGNVALNIA